MAYGLNEVETLRQSDGLSGALYNVPMIIGPSKFDVLYSTETGEKCRAPGTIPEPITSPGARSINPLDRPDRGGPSNRPAAHLATGCAPVTPTPGRPTALRRST